jgi:hypothetical protein
MQRFFNRDTRGENPAFCDGNDSARIHVQQILMQQSQPSQKDKPKQQS